MAPHAEEFSSNGHDTITADVPSNGTQVNAGAAPLEPGVKKRHADDQMMTFPRPPTFDDKYKERDYLKGRLAAAFRIFGKYGFDEGVAGHITLRDPVQPDCFWVNPFGTAFSLINKSDLIVSSPSSLSCSGLGWVCVGAA